MYVSKKLGNYGGLTRLFGAEAAQVEQAQVEQVAVTDVAKPITEKKMNPLLVIGGLGIVGVTGIVFSLLAGPYIEKLLP